MSLFGALTSGVSALGAQSGAMGAIADNIANVNTVGYKNAKVAFQTLVTKQASATMYSAGGVQARPRNAIDVQGLLQPTVSETDLAIFRRRLLRRERVERADRSRPVPVHPRRLVLPG